jgi:hypothetical protein
MEGSPLQHFTRDKDTRGKGKKKKKKKKMMMMMIQASIWMNHEASVVFG